ncbi:MAG: hypothetical protein AB1330_13230, partial [Bacillota bacterium]
MKTFPDARVVLKTYPEMNERIKDLLRTDGSPHAFYAAARIEELEERVRLLQETLSDVQEWLSDFLSDTAEYIGQALESSPEDI